MGPDGRITAMPAMSTPSTGGTGPDVLRVEVLGRAEKRLSGLRTLDRRPPAGARPIPCLLAGTGKPRHHPVTKGAALDDEVPPGCDAGGRGSRTQDVEAGATRTLGPLQSGR